MGKQRTSRIHEGDWFAVPLRHGLYAVGLAARVDKRGNSFLGYYFKSGSSREGESARIERLGPKDAILIGASGSFGLQKGLWPIIPSPHTWDRAAWPIPKFARVDFAGTTHYETYGDDDVLLPIPAADLVQDPRIPQHAVDNSLLDAAAVEDILWSKIKS